MGKQVTEMLEGDTVEGIVLAILSASPRTGYEITVLRRSGFRRHRRGQLVYALLIRIERRGLGNMERLPSEKGHHASVFPERPGTGISRRVIQALELPHGTARTAHEGGESPCAMSKRPASSRR